MCPTPPPQLRGWRRVAPPRGDIGPITTLTRGSDQNGLRRPPIFRNRTYTKSRYDRSPAGLLAKCGLAGAVVAAGMTVMLCAPLGRAQDKQPDASKGQPAES